MPTSSAEGGPPADYRALPRVTFTDPEIGAVGLTEQQARERASTSRSESSQMPEAARGWIHKAGNDGLHQARRGRRPRRARRRHRRPDRPVARCCRALAVAVHAEVPVDRLRHMIYAYPTFHRAILAAVRKLA